MITKLSIRNFKSIKELDIDCARVNLFIGEPNTGKSNILEALGVLSWCGSKGKDISLSDFVRFEYISNLFYDDLTDQIVKIIIANKEMLINVGLGIGSQSKNPKIYYGQFPEQKNEKIISLATKYQSDLDEGKYTEDLNREFQKINTINISFSNPTIQIIKTDQEWLIYDQNIILSIKKNNDLLEVYKFAWKNTLLDMLGNTGEYPNDKKDYPSLKFIKFYRYKQLDKFPVRDYSSLIPPDGKNMLALISSIKKHRETISSLFKDFGFKPMIREHVETLEQAKIIDDAIYSHPYITVSDTLKRMLFYNIAIDSNENSTLIFEEPEVHAFPLYIKQLGEKIAFDESNQYFIVTHNPYLFLSIVENVPKREDVNVFMTYMKDYQTKVKMANEMELSKLMRYDPFFNLLHMIEEKE